MDLIKNSWDNLQLETKRFLDDADVYLKAYGRHLFQSAPWVTLLSLLLIALLLVTPQASELVLAQATIPLTPDGAQIFATRLGWLSFFSLLVAASIWLSARMLISTEWHASHLRSYRRSTEGLPPAVVADTYVALFAPRQLGVVIFFTLQLAAARSISEHGYRGSVALLLIWLVLLAMLMLRFAKATERTTRIWWFMGFAAVGAYALGGLFRDMEWIEDRFPDYAWFAEQTWNSSLMAGGAIGICLVLIAIGPYVASGSRSLRWQLGATIAALAGIVLCFELAGIDFDAGMYCFIGAQSAAAWLYWMAVVGRNRRFAEWRRVALGSVRRRIIRFMLRRMRWFVGSGIVAFTAWLMTWAANDPIGMGRWLGGLGIVLAFFSFLLLLVATLQALIGKSSWRAAIPAGAVGVLILFGVFASATPPQDPPEEGMQLRSGPAPVDLATSVGALPQDGSAIFAVAAHGGGIRAALYTAAFSAWLDYFTGREFSRRFLVGSGASGGSIGLAVWSSARAANCQGLEVKEFAGVPLPGCVRAVAETLAKDHLAPVMASGLFRDYMFAPLMLPRAFVHTMPKVNPERGNTLRTSILRSAAGLAAEGLPGVADQLQYGLRSSPHALLLNTSQVGSAIPFAFATKTGMLMQLASRPGSYVTYVPSHASDDISLITAAIHSARFPVISPKGLVDTKSATVVVDGGYFDNSGVSVLRQQILALSDADKARVVVISIDNEPISSKKPARTADLNSIDEILGTILAARGAHGYAAWHQLTWELEAKRMFSVRLGAPKIMRGSAWPTEESEQNGVAFWKLQTEAHGPALGWYLSRRSALRVIIDAQDHALSVAVASGLLTDIFSPPRGGH